MKERPIFESKEPNKNLVKLNDDDKKVVTKALKDLIQSAGFFLDMVSKDTLTEEMRETLTSLIATYSRDGLQPLGFQDQATKDHDDLVRRLRNANMDNEELRQQLGQKVSLEDLREKKKKQEQAALSDEQPSASERIVENMKELGKAISKMGVKASDLINTSYEDCRKLTLPDPIGYLELEGTMTRLPAFKRIGWFRRMMLYWAFGLKYIKKED